MAKTRFTGRGGLVKFDVDGGGTNFNSVGLSRSITPPPQERAVIDVSGMEDTSAVAEIGTEELSSFEFVELHDSADAVDGHITNLYSNHAERTWQILFTDGTTVWTKQFTGKVAALIPQAVTGKDAVARAVRVARTGAITESQA
jgi:hypothetical protein